MTTYNRSAIMREANTYIIAGMSRSEAMKRAWASAKAPKTARQQEAGLRAALKRYGVDADRLAARAREAVAAIVAAIDTKRITQLPAPDAQAINLTRGSDGVYRI